MKVLVISHSRQASGYGTASRNYLLAMDSVGIDVVSRPVLVGGPQVDPSDKIKYLESKSSVGCDIVIQHLLPHYMVYSGDFKKNIGLHFAESHNYRLNPWTSNLNLMDEIWVPCNSMKEHDNGLTRPIRVVPIPCNLSKYQREYTPVDLEPLDGNYTFYYIGEFTKRKNLETLVTAFHLAFGQSEPVALLLKLSRPGHSDDTIMKSVSELCTQVKQSLRIYGNNELYRKEIIVTQHLTEEQIMRLHKRCDVFVSATHGEAWNLGGFDAVALGNLAILPNYGGHQKFIHPNFLVDVQDSPCIDMHETFPFNNRAHETWTDINISQLIERMRWCYINRGSAKYRNWYKNKIQEFSYESIGTKIKKILEGCETC